MTLGEIGRRINELNGSLKQNEQRVESSLSRIEEKLERAGELYIRKDIYRADATYQDERIAQLERMRDLALRTILVFIITLVLGATFALNVAAR